MKNIHFYSLIIFVLSLALISCAEIEENIPTKAELPGIHSKGFGSPGAPDFHSAKFAENNWDLKSCQSCHGGNYAGGSTGSSCITCHTESNGPESCNTCHGVFANPSRIAPPTDLLGNVSTTEMGVGAHAIHLYDTQISGKIPCFECHPSNPPGDDKFVFNHIDGLPAEIEFGSFTGAANYDAASGTCANTYCHGNFSFSRDSSDNKFAYSADFMTGNNFNPIWNKVDGTQAECGTCHGQYDENNNLISIAPVGHRIFEGLTCYNCHLLVVDQNDNIIDPTKHINGKIEFGD